MRKRIGFLDKKQTGKGKTITFTIATSGNGEAQQFTDFIKSVTGVQKVSDQQHETGMGYWIDVTIATESFDAALGVIRTHIQEAKGGYYDIKDWLDSKDWSADWLRG